jgi:hypothetical protein
MTIAAAPPAMARVADSAPLPAARALFSLAVPLQGMRLCAAPSPTGKTWGQLTKPEQAAASMLGKSTKIAHPQAPTYPARHSATVPLPHSYRWLCGTHLALLMAIFRMG